MTIDKLPSGSYRIRQQIEGKRYTIILPYKPSKKEANQLIMEKVKGKGMLRKTFGECAREYIDGKSHTLSPATIRGYESILKMLPDKITGCELCDLTAWDVQVYTDQLSKEGKSPKTVRNYHGFISSVLTAFNPSMQMSTQLPQKRKESDYIPSDEDVKRILLSAKGSVYEIPLRLACYGLRRSEICALDISDLDGNKLNIDKALVLNKNQEWEIKVTKTTDSTRTVAIDTELADMIREQGFIYEGYPNRIYWFLQKKQNELNIPNFPLHYLRHYYASTAHALGVPDADIMESGGWKTDHVMKRVYRHAKDVEKSQQAIVEHMSRLQK